MLLSTVTVPAVLWKMAKELFVNGALRVPVDVVQLLLPAEACHVPLPPSTRLLVLLAIAAPSQKFTGRPLVLTKLTWFGTAVWTRLLGLGALPITSPLSVSVPV